MTCTHTRFAHGMRENAKRTERKLLLLGENIIMDFRSSFFNNGFSVRHSVRKLNLKVGNLHLLKQKYITTSSLVVVIALVVLVSRKSAIQRIPACSVPRAAQADDDVADGLIGKSADGVSHNYKNFHYFHSENERNKRERKICI